MAKIYLQLDTTNKYKNNMFVAMTDLVREKGLRVFTVGYQVIQYRQTLWSAGTVFVVNNYLVIRL